VRCASCARAFFLRKNQNLKKSVIFFLIYFRSNFYQLLLGEKSVPNRAIEWFDVFTSVESLQEIGFSHHKKRFVLEENSRKNLEMTHLKNKCFMKKVGVND
jgi:hypothetical protein